jgi:hypothetical protein
MSWAKTILYIISYLCVNKIIRQPIIWLTDSTATTVHCICSALKLGRAKCCTGVCTLGVGQNQLPDTSNQIPTSDSGTSSSSGYTLAGCWYGIW